MTRTLPILKLVLLTACISPSHAFLPLPLLTSSNMPLSRRLNVCRHSGVKDLSLAMAPSGLPNIFGFFTQKQGVEVEEQARAVLKRSLFKAVKFNQGRKNREIVESILEEIAKLNMRGPGMSTIQGDWRLIWSSQTAEANPFSTPDSVLGGECFQVVQFESKGAGRVQNIVRWPQFGGLLIRGGASLRVTGPSKATIEIDSFTLEGSAFRISLLDLTDKANVVVKDAPKVKEGSQLVTVASSKGERKLNQREGELELLYLDKDGLRVSRGDNGLLYVYLRDKFVE